MAGTGGPLLLQSLFGLMLMLGFAPEPATAGSAALSATHSTGDKYSIGVNYGQLGNNLPPPAQAVKLIRRMRISKVKMYDANPAILNAFANTSIRVTVMVPNQQIPSIASSQENADEWVKHNVTYFYPSTRIRMVLVGNEILSDFSIQQTTWPKLVPAMKNIHTALTKFDLQHRIKVSTPHALNVLQSYVFPPSNGTFRSDIADPIIKPMLEFLSDTNSQLFVDAYPFFTWEFNRSNVSLDFALFNSSGGSYKDPGNGLVYDNLLDVQLDSVVAAMCRLGYQDVKLVLSETGWPTKGGVDERGANVYNAAMYNRRLVRKVLTKPALGTPRRRNQPIPTFIFALFNENLKPGPVTERNWGLLSIAEDTGSVSPSYQIDLLGRLGEGEYKPITKPPPEPLPGTLKIWCIANRSVSASQLQGALDYACGQGGADCGMIAAGKPCFLPNTTLSHASFAFNSYYLNHRTSGGSCNFNGAAFLTTTDPIQVLVCTLCSVDVSIGWMDGVQRSDIGRAETETGQYGLRSN